MLTRLLRNVVTSVCIVTTLANGAYALAPPSGQTVQLVGYVSVAGQTVLLYKDRQHAILQDELASCYNVGSDESLFAQLKRAAGKKVRILAVDLGDILQDYRQYGWLRSTRLRGRHIQVWCENPNIYWALTSAVVP